MEEKDVPGSDPVLFHAQVDGEEEEQQQSSAKKKGDAGRSITKTSEEDAETKLEMEERDVTGSDLVLFHAQVDVEEEEQQQSSSAKKKGDASRSITTTSEEEEQSSAKKKGDAGRSRTTTSEEEEEQSSAKKKGDAGRSMTTTLGDAETISDSDPKLERRSDEGTSLLPQLCAEEEQQQQRSLQAANDEECRVMFERESVGGSRGRSREEVEMDESLWKRLPEDLLERVLAWLPLASCVRFRSVCKRWYSMMYSRSFLELRSSSKEAPVCGPWLLSFGGSSSSSSSSSSSLLSPLLHVGFSRKLLEGNVYDPASKSSFKLQFPFLPEDSALVATAGGLVCFCCNTNESSSNNESDVSFYVCNPVTKAWKLIPSQCSKVSVVALLVNNTTTDSSSSSYSTSYKLIVFCEASTDRWLWMGIVDHAAKEYDSKLNRWKSIGGIYSGEQFRPGSVYCEGRLHLLSSETVQALDVQQGLWTDLQAPAYTSCAKLVECQGRLLLVGDMVHLNVFQLPDVSSYIGVVIWELGPGTKEWFEIGRMPEDMVENFCCSSFCCVVSGDLIYIFPKCERLQEIVVYDYSQQTWQQLQNWLKELPSSVFCFEPRLDASA